MTAFQPGDRVRCVEEDSWGHANCCVGNVLTVLEVGGRMFLSTNGGWWSVDRFILADPKPTPSEPPRGDLAWHDERAKTITGLFAAQVKAATELGLAAVPIGIGRDANPFADGRLAYAWLSGWITGNDGAAA